MLVCELKYINIRVNRLSGTVVKFWVLTVNVAQYMPAYASITVNAILGPLKGIPIFERMLITYEWS